MARALISLLLTGLPLLAAAIDGDDYRHGQTQVEQLLIDRPALTEHLIQSDPLITWASAQFAGVQTGYRVYWDSAPPPDGIEAQHQPRISGQPAIRLHDMIQSGPGLDQQKRFHHAWADLIFEFHNIAQGPKFESAFHDATTGRLGYYGWLERLTRAEHRALIETAGFYRTRWQPWMRHRGVEPAHRRWQTLQAVPIQYPDWIRRYTDPADYPYASYGRYYRDEVMPVLRASGLDFKINPFESRVIPILQPPPSKGP